METTQINIVDTITQTINTLFSNMFSSIDNNLYSVLDDLIFVKTDILENSVFSKLFGSYNTTGIILICNSLLIGFVLYYSILFLLSHITFSQVQKPSQFIFKLILCGIAVNFSYYICEKLIWFFSTLSLSVREIGEIVFSQEICLSTFIEKLNSTIFVETSSSFNLFSIEGLIKSFSSIGFLNLALSYALRYIMLKVFLLISPFAFLSLCLQNSLWIFKSWFKIILSLMFLQILVSIILLVSFSFISHSNDITAKLLYIGSIYSLIKANTFIRDFMGGLSTDISAGISSLKSFFTNN